MDSKIKELRRNTLIIAISNIGSRAIMFILAPLYSYFLNESQYGSMDLITTTVSLLAPLFCLDIYDATFRFASDKDENTKEIYSSSISLCLLGMVLGSIIIVISALFTSENIVLVCSVIFTFITTLINVMTQFARGRGEMRTFALSGVVNAVTLLISNSIFLLFLKLELTGWLISYFCAKVVTLLYLANKTHFWDNYSIKYVNAECINRMLKYCIPLMPTAIMWWIMNVSDRYMLAFFMGTAATGLYAVAGKIPSILSVFENVFYQAWQTTAISALSDKNKDAFYSNVFNKYIEIISIGSICILLILQPVIELLFAKPYHVAVKPAPILVLCIGVHAVAGNLGALYTAFKNTKGALYTSLIGAVTNVLLNIIFIPRYGMIGAAITTFIGYALTLIVRWLDIAKYVSIAIYPRNTLVPLGLLLIQFALYFYPTPWSYLMRTLIVVIVLVKEKNLIVSLIRR